MQIQGGGGGLLIDANYEFEIIEKLSICVKGQFKSIFAKIHLEGNKYVILGLVHQFKHAVST